jgi:hypothetical protein
LEALSKSFTGKLRVKGGIVDRLQGCMPRFATRAPNQDDQFPKNHCLKPYRNNGAANFHWKISAYCSSQNGTIMMVGRVV